MSMTETPKLVCKQCQYENEPERVYCHNCGAKLDRSLLPPEATKREDPLVVQQRLRKMTNPRRGAPLRTLKSLIACIAASAALAFVIQIARPPDGLPKLSQEAVDAAPTITDNLEDLAEAAGPRRLAYTADQVNAYFQYSIKGKENSVLGIPVKFERAFVHFDEGACQVFASQSIFGYPLYANGTYSVQIQGGKLVSTNLGGGIGRVRFPAKVSKFMDKVMAPLWKVTEREQRLLAKMQSVTFHKNTVEIISRSGIPTVNQ
jgi:hypothetical protein